MIIYRPHRGGFADAMSLAKEFETIKEMKEHIVQEHTDEDMGQAFGLEDIVLGDERKNDPRNGWKNTCYVCVKRYFSEVYSIPQCIGMFATEYEKKDNDKLRQNN